MRPLAARVTTALSRLGCGSWSQVKSIGKGVHELRVDTGPGYRVYFGTEGRSIVILLGGGTKRRQSRDIERAWRLWQELKRRQWREEARWH